MPGQDQEVVGALSPGFCLGHDRDASARRLVAELIRVNLGDALEQVRRDATILQNDITLGRGALPKYSLTLGPQPL